MSVRELVVLNTRWPAPTLGGEVVVASDLDRVELPRDPRPVGQTGARVAE